MADSARPAPARRPLFLGGLLSALLVGAALELDGLDACAWFGLFPLLIALERNRDRPWLRIGHGVSFGLLLAFWSQGWFYEAMLEAVSAARGEPSPTAVSILAAASGSLLAWSALALFPGLFAVAAGMPLRARSPWVPAVTLPLLWMGLEVLRGPLAPAESPWLSGWLALGYGFDPGTPASQFAAFAGVHGLGALAVLVSTSLLLALRPAALRQQLLWVAIAIASPAVVFALGHFATIDDDSGGPARPTTVGLLVHGGASNAAQLELARGAARGEPTVIVWPGLRASGRGTGPAETRAFLENVARAFQTPDLPDRVGAVLLSDRGGLVASYLPPLGQEPESALTGTKIGAARLFSTREGELGVGVAVEFRDSTTARRQVSAGAELLALSGGPQRPAGSRGTRQEIAMLSYRAIENRRWVAAASPSGGLLVDPLGRTTVELWRGASCGATGQAAWVEQPSVYTLCGWWLEPLALAATIATIAFGAIPWRRRSRQHARHQNSAGAR